MNSSSITKLNQLELEQARGLKAHLSDLSHEFLNAFDLTHIWVSRYYFDGRYVDITNDLSWKEKMLCHRFYNSFITNFVEPLCVQRSNSLFLTWQADLTSNIHLLRAALGHGILSGFNILKVNSDHIENYAFGSDKTILQVGSGLPSREELEMFCLYLKENILQTMHLKTPVLGNMKQHFSLLTSQLKSRKYSVPIPSSFSFHCNNKEGNLTQQQITCLGLLARGYGCKEIARIIELSPRTVESYISNIKRKYDNPSTAKLITTFNDSSLASVNPFMLHATSSNKSRTLP